MDTCDASNVEFWDRYPVSAKRKKKKMMKKFRAEYIRDLMGYNEEDQEKYFDRYHVPNEWGWQGFDDAEMIVFKNLQDGKFYQFLSLTDSDHGINNIHEMRNNEMVECQEVEQKEVKITQWVVKE